MDEFERLRETILRQELIFKEQVHELHRLYQRQKILMQDNSVVAKSSHCSRGESFGGGRTRDLLHALEDQGQDRIESSGRGHESRTKRRTFDLEQIPDDNDEDTEYVFDTSSARNTAFPAPLRQFDNFGTESSASSKQQQLRCRPLQEMALFPTLPGGKEEHLASSGRNGFDWQQQVYPQQHLPPWIAQNLGTAPQVGDPWKIFGAHLTGQNYPAENFAFNPLATIPDMIPSKIYASGIPGVQKSFAPSWQPYSYITQEILKNNNFVGSNGHHVPSNLSSRASWISSANNMPLPPLIENNPPPKLHKPDTATGVSTITQALGSEKTLSARQIVCKVDEDVEIEKDIAQCDVKGGAGTSCTGDVPRLELLETTNSVLDNSAAAEGFSKVGSARTRTREDTVDVSDSVTWAATILLSLSRPGCKNRENDVQETKASNLAASDVKLFKSVVSMMKKSGGKSGKKFVVSDDEQSLSQGRTIAALIKRTMDRKPKDEQQQKRRRRRTKLVVKEEESQDGNDEEDDEQAMVHRTRRNSLRESVHSNESAVETMTRTTAATAPTSSKKPRQSSSAAAAAQTQPAATSTSASTSTWLWGDVTRRKRMQRPRQQHPPTLRPQHHQVRCQN